MKILIFSASLKMVVLYMWACNVDSHVHTFYMRISQKKLVYDTRHVQRTVVYTARHRKRLSRARIKTFSMNLMVENGLIDRLKYGVGVEGERS